MWVQYTGKQIDANAHTLQWLLKMFPGEGDRFRGNAFEGSYFLILKLVHTREKVGLFVRFPSSAA